MSQWNLLVNTLLLHIPLLTLTDRQTETESQIKQSVRHNPIGCFRNLAGTGSTLFSGRLFWRQPIWWWCTEYFYGQQVIWDLAGTGTTLFSCGLFWMEAADLVVMDRIFFRTEGYLRFGGNWLYISFGRSVLEAADWVVMARLWWRSDDYLRFGGNWPYIISGGLFWRQPIWW